MNQTIHELDDSNVSRLLRQIREITSDELYDEMSRLKNKVLGLLKDYSSSLQLNSQIRKDALEVSVEYSVILDRVNASVDCSILSIESIAPLQKQEKELNNMFNLVEEFLEKFQGKKAKHNLYSSFISDKLERSGVSFADTSVIDVNQRISLIKNQLQESLQDQKYSKGIVIEAVDALAEALESEKIDRIRLIIKKIEKHMKECENQTTELYQLLQRALESCREKETELQNSSIIADKDNKRRFFDLALMVKSELPPTHPGRRVLVSMLYEQAQDVDEKQWRGWIMERLSNTQQ